MLAKWKEQPKVGGKLKRAVLTKYEKMVLLLSIQEYIACEYTKRMRHDTLLDITTWHRDQKNGPLCHQRSGFNKLYFPNKGNIKHCLSWREWPFWKSEISKKAKFMQRLSRIGFQSTDIRISIESNRDTSILAWGKSQKLGNYIEWLIVVLGIL